MVCLGNICRSPLAEAILQHKADEAGLSWQVESAGTNEYHTGDSPHPLSQKVALLHGLDISHQRSRRFEVDDFLKYDKIYVLAEEVVRDMRRLTRKKFDPSRIELLTDELYPGEHIDIPDPYFGHEMAYHQAYEMIDQACTAIIEKHLSLQRKTS